MKEFHISSVVSYFQGELRVVTQGKAHEYFLGCFPRFDSVRRRSWLRPAFRRTAQRILRSLAGKES
jgi:hypothetical protein